MSRPELTPKHRDMFRTFARFIYEMDQCRFVRKYWAQDHTDSGMTGEPKTTVPDYDWDDWPVIHFKIMPIKNATVMLFRCLLRDDTLNEADYPEEWRSAKRAWEAAKKEFA